MRSKRRDISVFSISALDLFAAALGAFILIVLVLFPYYRLGGVDISFEELEEQVQKRRLAAASTQSELSIIRALQAEIPSRSPSPSRPAVLAAALSSQSWAWRHKRRKSRFLSICQVLCGRIRTP